jgi:hypothetical protein
MYLVIGLDLVWVYLPWSMNVLIPWLRILGCDRYTDVLPIYILKMYAKDGSNRSSIKGFSNLKLVFTPGPLPMTMMCD